MRKLSHRLPLATLRTLKDALIHAARPDEIGVSVSYPLPGTRFYDLVKAQLGGKTHWHESNDLEMMFHGTYTSEFYRGIRKLLHDEVLLQTNSSVSPDDAAGVMEHGYIRRMRGIERRWDELIEREAHFRSPNRQEAVWAASSCRE